MADRLRRIFLVFTLLGTPFFYVPIAVVLATFNFAAAVKLAIILAAAEAFCGILKFIYPKERPIPLPRKTLYQKYEAGSFPSIHTARITVFAIITSMLTKNFAVVAVGVALIVAVAASRVYLRKHSWADVLGGLATGAVIGFAGMMV